MAKPEVKSEVKKENDWAKNDIGGLWKKRSQKGVPYLWGKLEINDEKVLIRAFKNKFKKDDDNTPDYRVYIVPNAKPNEDVVPVSKKKVVDPVEETEVEEASTGEEDL